MEASLGFLTGWGRVRRSACVMLQPADSQDLLRAFADPKGRAHGLIAHGAGRAYGDCALNEQGSVVMTRGLTAIRAFDASTGVVVVEPGVTFRQLLDRFLPEGFLPPVSPGTGFATIGGAVANDVHGKNHEHDGSFCQHVEEIGLLTPSGRVHVLSRAQEPALFYATCGGLGLTGVITHVRFRLKPVPGTGMRRTLLRCADLDAFLGAMEAARGAPYSVGWIDGTARGAVLGRGILETAEPCADGGAPPAAGFRIPVNFPDVALNPLSVRLFNELYFRRVGRAPRTGVVRTEKFLYPLDALREWNRIYGVRGFYQFQAVVPFADGAAALRRLLEVVAASRRASFLAVLKRMGPGIGPAGPLSFPMAGYTLALDFPAGASIPALYAALTRITRDCGGRIYLAKDALLDTESFRAMYPRWREFAAMLREIDPRSRLQSDMSRRLGLRDADG